MILGGGVIGIEFAYIMRSFGVDVTVVEIMPQILPYEDSEVRVPQICLERIQFQVGRFEVGREP